MMHPPSNEAAAGEISVVWDVEKCPVLNDYHARQVGPCVKRYLRDLGYSGRITITAVGVLEKVPEKILEAVYSTGISLNTGPYGLKDMVRVLHTLPHPPNIMVISSPRKCFITTNYLKEEGCNLFFPFPFDSDEAHIKYLWKMILSGPEIPSSETVEPASWVCAVCYGRIGKDFEKFIPHLSSPEHKRLFLDWFPPTVAVEAPAPLISGGGLNQRIGGIDLSAVAAISVFWDIKSCPVPDGYDARLVGPCIKRFLRNSGYSGPITITAVGVLSKVPEKILEAVFSTGISLYNGPYGPRDMVSLIIDCFVENPPPANIMVISRPLKFSNFIHYLNGRGYNTILPFPFDPINADAKGLWKKFLIADPGELEDDKCSETGEPASCVCAVCDEFGGGGFENFIKHLSTQEHKRELPLWFEDEKAAEAREDEEAVEGSVDTPLENATTMVSE